MKAVALLAVLLAAFATSPAEAVRPDERLADPALEARARDISKELRCLVCQNQSIDDSEAPLARDLRILVRERLRTGDGDDAVVRHIVDRYGDFVRLRPPFKASTYVLWFGPAIVAGLGLMAVIVFLRRRVRQAPVEAPLTLDERRRLAALGEERPR